MGDPDSSSTTISSNRDDYFATTHRGGTGVRLSTSPPVTGAGRGGAALSQLSTSSSAGAADTDRFHRSGLGVASTSSSRLHAYQSQPSSSYHSMRAASTPTSAPDFDDRIQPTSMRGLTERSELRSAPMSATTSWAKADEGHPDGQDRDAPQLTRSSPMPLSRPSSGASRGVAFPRATSLRTSVNGGGGGGHYHPNAPPPLGAMVDARGGIAGGTGGSGGEDDSRSATAAASSLGLSAAVKLEATAATPTSHDHHAPTAASSLPTLSSPSSAPHHPAWRAQAPPYPTPLTPSMIPSAGKSTSSRSQSNHGGGGSTIAHGNSAASSLTTPYASTPTTNTTTTTTTTTTQAVAASAPSPSYYPHPALPSMSTSPSSFSVGVYPSQKEIVLLQPHAYSHLHANLHNSLNSHHPAPTTTVPAAPPPVPLAPTMTMMQRHHHPSQHGDHPLPRTVHELLASLELLEYYDAFLREGFDRIEALGDITELDFEVVGVRRGHRRLIQRGVASLRGLPFTTPLPLAQPVSAPPLSPLVRPVSDRSRTSLASTSTEGGGGGPPTTTTTTTTARDERAGSSTALVDEFDELEPVDDDKSMTLINFDPNEEDQMTRRVSKGREGGNGRRKGSTGVTQTNRNVFYIHPSTSITPRSEASTSSPQPLASTSTKRRYRRHPKPDVHAPIKPASAYVEFSTLIRQSLSSSKSFTEIARIVGEKWQALPSDEKERLEHKALRAKEKYVKDLETYRGTEEWKMYERYLEEFRSKYPDSTVGAEGTTAGGGGKKVVGNGMVRAASGSVVKEEKGGSSREGRRSTRTGGKRRRETMEEDELEEEDEDEFDAVGDDEDDDDDDEVDADGEGESESMIDVEEDEKEQWDAARVLTNASRKESVSVGL